MGKIDLEGTYLNGYECMINEIKSYDFLGKSKIFDEEFYLNKTHLVWGKENPENVECFVSYIVPTYNRPQLLKETLISILKQPDAVIYEVIVADNTEPEREDVRNANLQIIQSLNDKKIKYYQNVKTTVDSWNICLALAKGKWVCMVHDDDLLLSDHLKSLVDMVNKNKKVKMLTCKNINFTNIDQISQKQKVSKDIKRCPYTEFMYGMPAGLLGAFVDRKAAYEIGGFDVVSQMADYVFVTRMAYYYNVYISQQKLYAYRISELQDSANYVMNSIRRISDYYLWVSIAQKRSRNLVRFYMKNCEYNLMNRIDYCLKDNNYENGKMDKDLILNICDIKSDKINYIEYWGMKGLHLVNRVIEGIKWI